MEEQGALEYTLGLLGYDEPDMIKILMQVCSCSENTVRTDLTSIDDLSRRRFPACLIPTLATVLNGVRQHLLLQHEPGGR